MSQTSTLTSNGLHMNIFSAYHNLNDIRFFEEHDILVISNPLIPSDNINHLIFLAIVCGQGIKK